MAIVAGQKLRAADLYNEFALAGSLLATDYISTSQSTTTTGSWVNLATVGPTVTVFMPQKRWVAIVVGAGLYQSGAAFAVQMSFAISGATTVAADYMQCVEHNGNGAPERFCVMSWYELNAGTNTIQAKYRCAGGTANYFDRRLAVLQW